MNFVSAAPTVEVVSFLVLILGNIHSDAESSFYTTTSVPNDSQHEEMYSTGVTEKLLHASFPSEADTLAYVDALKHSNFSQWRSLEEVAKRAGGGSCSGALNTSVLTALYLLGLFNLCAASPSSCCVPPSTDSRRRRRSVAEEGSRTLPPLLGSLTHNLSSFSLHEFNDLPYIKDPEGGRVPVHISVVEQVRQLWDANPRLLSNISCSTATESVRSSFISLSGVASGIILAYSIAQLNQCYPDYQEETKPSHNIWFFPIPRQAESRYKVRSLPPEMLVEGEDEPDDGCGRVAVRMASGNCAPLFSSSFCPYMHWVLLNRENAQGECTPQLCSNGKVFVEYDQMCHDVNEPGFCPSGQRLYLTAWGEAVCDCIDGTFYGPDGKCHRLFEPAYCHKGTVLQFHKPSKTLMCKSDQCQGFNSRLLPNTLPYARFDDDACYQFSSVGPCEEDHRFGFDIEALMPSCVSLEEAGLVRPQRSYQYSHMSFPSASDTKLPHYEVSYVILNGSTWELMMRTVGREKRETKVHGKGYIKFIDTREFPSRMELILPALNEFGVTDDETRYGTVKIGMSSPLHQKKKRSKRAQEYLDDGKISYNNKIFYHKGKDGIRIRKSKKKNSSSIARKTKMMAEDEDKSQQRINQGIKLKKRDRKRARTTVDNRERRNEGSNKTTVLTAAWMPQIKNVRHNSKNSSKINKSRNDTLINGNIEKTAIRVKSKENFGHLETSSSEKDCEWEIDLLAKIFKSSQRNQQTTTNIVDAESTNANNETEARMQFARINDNTNTPSEPTEVDTKSDLNADLSLLTSSKKEKPISDNDHVFKERKNEAFYEHGIKAQQQPDISQQAVMPVTTATINSSGENNNLQSYLTFSLPSPPRKFQRDLGLNRSAENQTHSDTYEYVTSATETNSQLLNATDDDATRTLRLRNNVNYPTTIPPLWFPSNETHNRSYLSLQSHSTNPVFTSTILPDKDKAATLLISEDQLHEQSREQELSNVTVFHSINNQCKYLCEERIDQNNDTTLSVTSSSILKHYFSDDSLPEADNSNKNNEKKLLFIIQEKTQETDASSSDRDLHKVEGVIKVAQTAVKPLQVIQEETLMPQHEKADKTKRKKKRRKKKLRRRKWKRRQLRQRKKIKVHRKEMPNLSKDENILDKNVDSEKKEATSGDNSISEWKTVKLTSSANVSLREKTLPDYLRNRGRRQTGVKKGWNSSPGIINAPLLNQCRPGAKRDYNGHCRPKVIPEKDMPAPLNSRSVQLEPTPPRIKCQGASRLDSRGICRSTYSGLG